MITNTGWFLFGAGAWLLAHRLGMYPDQATLTMLVSALLGRLVVQREKRRYTDGPELRGPYPSTADFDWVQVVAVTAPGIVMAGVI